MTAITRALGSLPRGGEHCPDLGRVVGVIVDHDRAIGFADLCEAPFYPFEPFEPGNDCFIRNAKLQRHRDRGQRVLDVVTARDRHVKRDGPTLAVPAEDQRVEPRSARHRRHIVRPDVGERREAVGDDPPVADPADDVLNLGMIDAQHRETVEGHVLDELDERVLDAIEIAIMLEMLGIDVGDDGDGSVEPEEAAVALVSLDHPPVAFPSRALEP